MQNLLDLSQSRAEKDYHIGDIIEVNDRMQKNYHYVLTAPLGEDFDAEFTPDLSPAQMLELGIFEGKYLNDCTDEFPKEWYEKSWAKLSPTPNPKLNYFKIKSRQSLRVWQDKGWIAPDDPDVRGWFQWYCRYWLGRREPLLDQRQIRRWKAFRRHAGQIRANCQSGNLDCRPRQRQALLQWAYDPFI